MADSLLDVDEATSRLDAALWLTLPLVVLMSSTGMLIIKRSEQIDNWPLLCIGLSIEGCAFLIYPLSMRKYHLRTITACWAGGSMLAAVTGGALLFDEWPTPLSLTGCACVAVGIIANAMG